MKRDILINIPHTSLNIPRSFKKIVKRGYDFRKENKLLADLYVDKFVSYKYHKVVSKVARIVCDMERYKDDKKETMAKIGMGVIYERDTNGYNFIHVNEKYKRKIIKKYYNPYHNKLDSMTKKLCKRNDKVFFIDLHSFSDLLVKKLFNYTDTPDVCIGIDETTSKDLIKLITNYFSSKGYSVHIDYPYKGTLIPNIVFKENIKNIDPIMIEINKRIYLNNNKIDKIKFKRLKKDLNNLFNIIITN